MEWISYTFLRIRARKNPKHYGIPVGLTPDQIDKKLLGKPKTRLHKIAETCYFVFFFLIKTIVTFLLLL